MKKYFYLIIIVLISSLVLTGCLLSNVGQVPVTEQSGITYLTKNGSSFTVGNDDAYRSITDTYHNFTIIDTNHPSSELGQLTTFSYYAANTNPFRFVLVNGSAVVKWVSDEITPPSTGAQSWPPSTPVYVEPGWNLGLYFALTGTVPFSYTGDPAWYEPNNAGLPVVGETLSYQGSSNRIYSFVATGDVAELPSVPTITWPANGVYITTAALTHIDWTDSTGTFTPLVYKYEAYGDANYTSLIYESVWLNVSEIPSPGTPEDVYYIRVRAKDNMGNLSDWSNGSTEPYIIYKITVDNTLPVITLLGVTPVTIEVGSVYADAGATALDNVDGNITANIVTVNLVNTAVLGTYTVTYNVNDAAGNPAIQVTRTVNVIYHWDGFFRPVDNLPMWNIAKAGSAIPVKFSLNGFQDLDIFESGYPKSGTIDCDSAALNDTIEETVNAGGSSLNYDADADQYIYVWKTNKAWAGSCRQLVVNLNDGTSHLANFTFK